MSDGKDYYVYELCRPNGQVFYVGKGVRWRINMHEWHAGRGRRGLLYNVIRKIQKRGLSVIKRKVAVDLSDQQAKEIERELIRKYGRIENGGPLVNMTDGGDGSEGFRHDLVSLANMRSAWKPRVYTEETKARMSAALRGRKQSEETKKKLSQKISGEGHWNYGKTISAWHKERLHSSLKRKVSVDGVLYDSVGTAAKAHGICSSTAVYRLRKGKRRGNKYGEWKYV